MTSSRKDAQPRRNRGYNATHQTIIEAAIRMISESGVDALSLAALARTSGIHRTTLYYHFDDREALIEAVNEWSAQQLARGFDHDLPQRERIDHIARFVLENSEVIKLFIDDFIAPGDIRHRYSQWDGLVEGIARDLAGKTGDPVDAEVYCVLLLTAAFIAPRVYKHSVRPDLGIEEIVARFSKEQMRRLALDGLLNPETAEPSAVGG